MRRILTLVIWLFWATTLFAQPRSSTTVYSEYFTSYAVDSIPPSARIVRAGQGPLVERSPRGFELLGRFGDRDTVHLRLTDLPRHSQIKVSIGFHVIGSWDGEQDADRMNILLDGKTHLSESFSNTIYRQTFPGLKRGRTYPPRTGARNSNMLGFRFTEPGVYDGVMDASYVEEIEQDHTGGTLDLVITASLSDVRKGLDNESWGLEHIRVTVLGQAPTEDMWPTSKRDAEPERVWDHAEVVDFDGPDERVVAGYRQNEDLPDMPPGSPWESQHHATLLRTKCMSCGMFCMMYTVMIYADNWVNVWSNREAFGPASWSVQITPAEVDTMRRLIQSCLDMADMADSYEAEDIFDNPDQPHCEFHFSVYGREREVSIYGGEPPVITAALQALMTMLKRHGWEPTPFHEE